MKQILCTILFFLSSCGNEYSEAPISLSSSTRSADYFTNSKALYMIEGKKYAVPMGYLWFQSIKYDKWPTPKTHYTETTLISVEALLPNFKPYSMENAALFDERVGHGDIVKVSIYSLTGKHSIEKFVDNLAQTNDFELQPESTLHGLSQYVRMRGSSPNPSTQHFFFPSDLSKDSFWIMCRIYTFSPSCSLYDYRGDGVHAIKTIFALKYLSDWRQIRRQSADLVVSFAP